ncbi:hypothetical protein IAT38_000796 [Cryptococcus sp. DSM 104549]
MPPAPDAWTTSFRTPSPSTDPEDCLPSQSGIPAGGNDLIRDLDLSLRDDRAVYKSTPFTIAKQKNPRAGARKIGNVLSAEERKKAVLLPSYGKTVAKPKDFFSSKDKGKGKADPPPSRPSPPPPSHRPPAAAPRSGPRPAVRGPLPPPPDEDKPRRNKSGWVDQRGDPVADAPAPKRPSILKALEEREREEEKKERRKEKAKATRKRNAEIKKREKKEKEDKEKAGSADEDAGKGGKKGKKEGKKEGSKKSEEKLEFGAFPKDAGPTEDYPILLALDKQKNLPVKPTFQPPKPKLRPGEITRSPRRQRSPIDNLDDLIYGPSHLRQRRGLPWESPEQGGTADNPVVLDTPPSRGYSTRTTPTLVNASSGRSNFFSVAGGGKHTKSTGTSSRRTYVNPGGSEDDAHERENYKAHHAYDVLSDEEEPVEQDEIDELDEEQEQDHPSTITQLPSSVAREMGLSMSTSSAVPFSSPLAGRGRGRGGMDAGRETVQPLARRAERYGAEGYRSMDVERLEAAAETYEALLRRNLTPVNMYRSPTRAVTSKAKISPYANKPFIPPAPTEWSTLPTKRKTVNSSNTTFRPPTNNTFKLPFSLSPSLTRPDNNARPRIRKPATPSPPPASPPRKYSKLTLFTPSSLAEDSKRPPKPVYTVKTIKGSRYAPSADMATSYRPSAGITGRLTLPPSATAPRAGGYARWAYSRPQPRSGGRDEQEYEGAYGGQGPDEAGPSSAGYIGREQEDEVEEEGDWTSAWKVQGGRGDRARDLEEDAAEQYRLQPYGRY